MIAIIPAKSNSKRIINKNYRYFDGKKSLCDIQIEKLLLVLSPSQIYLSAEEPEIERIAERYSINFIKRDKELTDNNTPIVDVIRGIYEQVNMKEDVMWCQVINPFFTEYQECLDIWKKLSKEEYDSLVTVYSAKEYILNESYHPVNFQFGAWHSISQNLHEINRLNFTFSILSPKAIEKTGYYIGEKPYWYKAKGFFCDIDLENDWQLAQLIYSYMKEKNI